MQQAVFSLEELLLRKDKLASNHCYCISNEVYHHKDCPGLSKSDLDLIHRSIAHYEHKKNIVEDKEISDDLLIGQMFHDFILTPSLIQRYKAKPETDARTKIGKEIIKEFEATLDPQDIIVPRYVFTKVMEMVDAFRKNNLCQSLTEETICEHAFFWKDEETNLLCKCKPDIWSPKHNVIIDLKTSQDASFNAFRRSIKEYNYDKQAAYYSTGVSAVTGQTVEGFIFIVIEKKPPYGIAIYQLDDASIEVGRRLFKKDLQKYKRYTEGQETYGYSDEILLINLPAYGFDEDSR